ncbi:MAG: alpha/beta fold hydrolase [Planctomycetes bacterium]|nr:alpha/beta fold hydrolase [Planctomycetota bacterium]
MLTSKATDTHSNSRQPGVCTGSALTIVLVVVVVLILGLAAVSVAVITGAWMLSPTPGPNSNTPAAGQATASSGGSEQMPAATASDGSNGDGALMSVVATQVESDDPTIKRVVIPLSDGALDLGVMLGVLGDELGLNGSAITQAIKWQIPVKGGQTGLGLMAIEQVTRGVVAFDVTDDQMVMEIDQWRLRRDRSQMQEGLRRLLGTIFPDAAAAAQAQFGITVHRADGSEMPFDAFVTSDAAEGLPTHAVVLIHGLDEPGKLWRSVIPPLLEEDYFVLELDYPNDQAILDSADDVAQNFAQLKAAGIERISLVTHSMGGLVSREILTNPQYYAGHGSGHEIYPDVQRLVMVGTPNHGSTLAKLRIATEIREQFERALSGEGLLLGALYDGSGEAADDLKPGSPYLTELNSRPMPDGVHLTIIAGMASPITADAVSELEQRLKGITPDAMNEPLDETGQAFTELVGGVGDGCVTLDSARLDAVDDFTMVDGNHLSMIRNWTSGSSRIPPAVPIIMDRLNADRQARAAPAADGG